MTKIVISKTKMSVTKNGAPVKNVAKLEFDLLYYMASRRDKVITRQELVNNVWNTFVIDRTVDVHIRKLRVKFSEKPDDSANNDLIQTVLGTGYKLIGNVTIEDEMVDGKIEMESGVVIGGFYENANKQIVYLLNIADSKHGKMVIFVRGKEWTASAIKDFTNTFKLLKNESGK